ncbi:MAG: hypothetical protein ACRC7G_00535 [Beijerinckiaceae bacterium]
MTELQKEARFAKLDFLRFDFDTEAAFKQAYKVPVRSVIIVFRNGHEIERITANGDKAAIEALLKKAL